MPGLLSRRSTCLVACLAFRPRACAKANPIAETASDAECSTPSTPSLRDAIRLACNSPSKHWPTHCDTISARKSPTRIAAPVSQSSRLSAPRSWQYRVNHKMRGFLRIWPSVRPLDQDEEIASLTADLSLMTPLANEATKPDLARASHGSRSANDLLRIMAWKSAMTSRASTPTPNEHARLECGPFCELTARRLSPLHRAVRLHRCVVRPPAALGRRPVNILGGVLDVAGFAMDAVLRVDHKPRIRF